jgi:hypothetical protein
MTPEGKVKVWLVNQFQARYGKGIWSYAPPGGMFGQAGQADRFFLIYAVFIVIEVKQEGGKLTDLQKFRMRKAAEAGAVSASMIGKDYEKLYKIFAEIDRRITYNKDLFNGV